MGIAILDFSKAFDTVSHDEILCKLESYGITGSLREWLRTFLSKRRMQVVIEWEASEKVTINSVVQQWTALGPILFLCHINDLQVTSLFICR